MVVTDKWLPWVDINGHDGQVTTLSWYYGCDGQTSDFLELIWLWRTSDYLELILWLWRTTDFLELILWSWWTDKWLPWVDIMVVTDKWLPWVDIMAMTDKWLPWVDIMVVTDKWIPWVDIMVVTDKWLPWVVRILWLVEWVLFKIIIKTPSKPWVQTSCLDDSHTDKIDAPWMVSSDIDLLSRSWLTMTYLTWSSLPGPKLVLNATAVGVKTYL